MVASTLLGGCATYRPASLQSIAEGREVRVQVSESGSERVEEFTAGSEQETVEGTFVRAVADSAVLALWRSDMTGGSSTLGPGRVQVPFLRSEILAIEEKEISYLRTSALVAGVVGGLYFLFDQVFGASEGGELPGGGGPEITLLPSMAAPGS